MTEAWSEYDDPDLYDAENPWGPDDDFYLARARQCGGPVLDLACGTGRLARAMAAAGVEVVGVDSAPAMLAHAAKAGTAGLTLVEGDMRSLDLGRGFALVVVTGHAFQHLLTEADQLACLERVRAHLAEGGRFAFEIRNQRPRALKDRAWHSFEAGGRRVDIFISSRFDPESGIDTVLKTFRFHGEVEARMSEVRLKYTPLPVLDDLLGRAGLRVAEQYGDWSLGPADETAPEIVTVAVAADRGAIA